MNLLGLDQRVMLIKFSSDRKNFFDIDDDLYNHLAVWPDMQRYLQSGIDGRPTRSVMEETDTSQVDNLEQIILNKEIELLLLEKAEKMELFELENNLELNAEDITEANLSKDLLDQTVNYGVNEDQKSNGAATPTSAPPKTPITSDSKVMTEATINKSTPIISSHKIQKEYMVKKRLVLTTLELHKLDLQVAKLQLNKKTGKESVAEEKAYIEKCRIWDQRHEYMWGLLSYHLLEECTRDKMKIDKEYDEIMRSETRNLYRLWKLVERLTADYGALNLTARQRKYDLVSLDDCGNKFDL